jgi:Domain of unknown function (DUF397)
MSTVDLSGVAWRKSSRSGQGGNGNCVEVALAGPVVGVRDSKSPGAGALVLPASGWAGFLRGLAAR